jgi:tetratricopeptide (TPR) repeat protein
VLTNEIVFIETNTACDRALAADRQNVLALTWSAFRLMPSLGRGHDAANDLKEVDVRLSKALAIDPTYAPAHLAKAFALQSQFRLDEAIGEDRRAIELDPNLADAYWHLGFLLRRTCKYQMSLESIDEAIFLSPRDSFRSVWYADKAGSHMQECERSDCRSRPPVRVETDRLCAPLELRLRVEHARSRAFGERLVDERRKTVLGLMPRNGSLMPCNEKLTN